MEPSSEIIQCLYALGGGSLLPDEIGVIWAHLHGWELRRRQGLSVSGLSEEKSPAPLKKLTRSMQRSMEKAFQETGYDLAGLYKWSSLAGVTVALHTGRQWLVFGPESRRGPVIFMGRSDAFCCLLVYASSSGIFFSAGPGGYVLLFSLHPHTVPLTPSLSSSPSL